MDRGSSTEIMYEHYFSQLPEQIRKKIQQPPGYLTSFAGHLVWEKKDIICSINFNRSSNTSQKYVDNSLHNHTINIVVQPNIWKKCNEKVQSDRVNNSWYCSILNKKHIWNDL
uniref:Uncharacterized protein n=1 Tax=Lactuca sativa TaxID=4236 RepID=A0A9R1X8F3_LACSA|nr:hypothetical protein LSAT_V11C500266940 [Lactuca sativa]